MPATGNKRMGNLRQKMGPERNGSIPGGKAGSSQTLLHKCERLPTGSLFSFQFNDYA
jgi:hypothetical protein